MRIKIYITYAFIKSLVTKCIVQFTKCILYYENILVSQLFEHVQYNVLFQLLLLNEKD